MALISSLMILTACQQTNSQQHAKSGHTCKVTSKEQEATTCINPAGEHTGTIASTGIVLFFSPAVPESICDVMLICYEDTAEARFAKRITELTV